jgi:uncharacterized protein (DUF1778 family)
VWSASASLERDGRQRVDMRASARINMKLSSSTRKLMPAAADAQATTQHSLVWVDSPAAPHLISVRKGVKHEERKYWQAIQD